MGVLAIVGRPNVGKSTLFNRLVGMRQAIVDETAGVTRDRHYGKAEWCGKEFSVIDTGGYTSNSDDIFEGEIRKQVSLAIDEADVILFLCEVETGITDYDSEIAAILRRCKKPVILAVNKVDTGDKMYGAYEFNSLGLGEPFCIAAASGGSIEVFHILSEPKEGWTGETGFITADTIKKLVPDWASVSYFISGPQAMYQFLDGEFAKMNIRKKFIRKEEFGESDDITKSPLYPKGNEEKPFKIKVIFGKDEQVIDAKATDTVVVSLEKAGIAPDSHCRSGACGFCRSLLLEGEVWQRPQSDGVRAADKDMGYFHPCSAYPMSDLTIQVCSRL